MKIEKKQHSILIADDNPNNLKVLSSMLEEQGYKVRVSQNGEQVMKSVKLMKPDLILLDIHMPILDGYETCKQLKAESLYKDIPVIFVSAMSEAFNKLLAFNVGGIDYIEKPFQLEEVCARVKTHLDLKFARDKMKEHDALFSKYKDLIDFIQKIDIEELKNALQEMEELQDKLTSLSNISEDQKIDLVRINSFFQGLVKPFLNV